MNKIIEEYRKKFIIENDFYEKVYLTDEEQEKLNQLVHNGFENEESPFKKYKYENIGSSKYKFYEAKPIEVSDSELNQYISMKMLDLTKEMNDKQSTIKNIMVFWVILTIISLFGSIYTAVKIGEFL